MEQKGFAFSEGYHLQEDRQPVEETIDLEVLKIYSLTSLWPMDLCILSASS
jgi:hypothetical protein